MKRTGFLRKAYCS